MGTWSLLNRSEGGLATESAPASDDFGPLRVSRMSVLEQFHVSSIGLPLPFGFLPSRRT